MNKTLIILIVLVLAISLFYCWSNVEGFGDAIKVEGVVNNTLSESKIVSEQPKTIQELKAQVSELQPDEILWEKRPIKVNDIINILKSEFAECGARDLNITVKDLNFADSRMKFVKFLPVTNLINKLTYETIKCFVQKIDRNNLVSWIKEEVTMPKYLLPHNIVIVNNMLYQASPYGVLKYKVPALSQYKGNNALNATIECSLLNDYNFYNRSTDIIFPFQGALIQKVGSEYKDLRTDDKYEIMRLVDRVDLMNSRVAKELNLSEISSKFEDKPKQEIKQEIVQEVASEVKEELKKEVSKEVFNNDELKNTLVRISQSQNLPEIKDDVNKLLARLVATKVDTAVSAKVTTPVPSQPVPKVAAPKIAAPKIAAPTQAAPKVAAPTQAAPKVAAPTQAAPKVVQRFSNIYENFAMVGIINKERVTGKDTLGIAKQVIQEVLVQNKDVKTIKSAMGEVNVNKLNEEVIFVAENNGVNYLFAKNEVKPHSIWAKQVNKLLGDSRTNIRTVIPHFYMDGETFKSRIILILEDDFYVVIENDKMEAPKDWAKEMGFSFSANLPEVYTCNENKVILEQMVRANVITDDRRQQVLNKLKCQN
jgi:hypothetical protein